MRSLSTSVRRLGVVLALAAFLPVGCGYSVRPPYNPGVRTVYVPMFRSFTYRKDLNFTLTYMVQAEIANRTPFKVVNDPDEADTTLFGTIRFADKAATVESPNNLPRQVLATMMVEVKWVDNRNLDEKKDVVPAIFYNSFNFYPELGETSELGFQKDLQKLAKQIVDAMEEPF